HGNGGNLSYTGWLLEELSARGFDVLALDYRGYGRSEGEATDETGIYRDADAAYDYLMRERGVLPEKIVLYGQSLGTTAAVDVASRRRCAAIVLESGLSSAREMAALILPRGLRWLHALAQNSFASTRKLESVRCPVLVAHGALDSTIPVEQAHLLYNAAREPKRLLIVPGANHNDVVNRGGKEYLDTIASFARDAAPRTDALSAGAR
ncbi:MAG TPA: alpha/beta hydrolase, partial [Pyrinomonadaceae bacterium]|nr:alpha/beta hydrolase [Pyrinomonadaceae bacterium]